MSLVEEQALEGHEDRVWAVEWSPKGDLLASCSGDRTVRMWSRYRGGAFACVAVLDDSHTKAVRSLSWSPCGTKLATASFDAKTSVWKLSGGEWEMVALLEGHDNEVKSAAWSQDGAMLATCSRDKSVWIWEQVDDRNEFECVDVKQKHTQDVKYVRWHPGWEVPLLVSCSYDNSIMVWTDDGDADDWRCAQTLAKESGGHSSTVWQVAFEPTQGDRMVSCSDDCTLKVWSCGKQQSSGSTRAEPSWRHLCTLSGFHDRTVYSCDWSASGLIASGSADHSIRVFEEDPEAAAADPTQPGKVSFRQAACRDSAHDSRDVNSVRWSPSEPGLLASAGDDGLVRLWRFSAASPGP